MSAAIPRSDQFLPSFHTLDLSRKATVSIVLEARHRCKTRNVVSHCSVEQSNSWIFVELSKGGKRFWSQMVANQKSDFSEYVFDGFFEDLQAANFQNFDVLIK
jgi:hypothetical protein